MQVDAFRRLRLPAVLVADSRLGGISATLSAYDSLLLRGYDVAAVVALANPEPPPGANIALDNEHVISAHIRDGPATPGAQLFTLPPAPEPCSHGSGTADDPALDAWLTAASPVLHQLRSHLAEWHSARRARLLQLGNTARSVLWWPFTQHATLGAQDVTVIDSRAGESFLAVCDAPEGQENAAGEALAPLYDGCASWWTQGLSETLQPRLRHALAYGMGRYAHVISPEAAHEPGVRLSEMLLQGVGSGWASRVFFSDDGCDSALPCSCAYRCKVRAGTEPTPRELDPETWLCRSTAIEVALKMAFRTYTMRHGDKGTVPMQVIALTNGYHGDTLGTMDCAEASVFNAGQTPWYQPRGLFLDPPTVGIVAGLWQVCTVPEQGAFWSIARQGHAKRTHAVAGMRASSALHQVVC